LISITLKMCECSEAVQKQKKRGWITYLSKKKNYFFRRKEDLREAQTIKTSFKKKKYFLGA